MSGNVNIKPNTVFHSGNTFNFYEIDSESAFLKNIYPCFFNKILDIINYLRYILVMKKVLLGLFLILFITTLFAEAILVNFNAYSDSEGVQVVWDTGAETNVQSFIVERSSSQSSWAEVSSSIQPQGNNSHYSFHDESIFKTTDYVFNYRLRIVDNDGTISHSESILVTLNDNKISGFKRTWGSIKAMFR